jgi:hypothetical protein
VRCTRRQYKRLILPCSGYYWSCQWRFMLCMRRSRTYLSIQSADGSSLENDSSSSNVDESTLSWILRSWAEDVAAWIRGQYIDNRSSYANIAFWGSVLP